MGDRGRRGGGRLWEDERPGSSVSGGGGGGGPGGYDRGGGGRSGRRRESGGGGGYGHRRGPTRNIVSERETGVVQIVKTNFGFIRCCDRPGQMFFHFSAVADNSIRSGDEVEFDVSEEPSTGKLCAVRMRILPEGTVSFTEVIDGVARGIVARDLDGQILEVWAETDEGKEAIAHHPLNTALLAYSVRAKSVAAGGDDEGGAVDGESASTGTVESEGMEGSESVNAAESEDATETVVTECVPFSRSDVLEKRPAVGDQVSFQFAVDKRTRRRCAVRVKVEKRAVQQRYTGVISNRRGYIQCLELGEDVAFRASDITASEQSEESARAQKKWSRGGGAPSRPQVRIFSGQEVEFSVVLDRRLQEKRATNIVTLPQGTVKFHELLPERQRGVVAEATVERRPHVAERPGSIETVLGVDETKNTETVEIFSFVIGDLAASARHVKPRPGDTVEFNVKVDKRSGVRTAGEIVVVEQADEPREQGKVSKNKGEFGFIRCVKRDGELFFHISDLEEEDVEEERDGKKVTRRPQLREGDDVEFVVSRNEKGDPYAVRIRRLERGTVKFQRVLAGTYFGLIHRQYASRGVRGSDYHVPPGQISLLQPRLDASTSSVSDSQESTEIAASDHGESADELKSSVGAPMGDSQELSESREKRRSSLLFVKFDNSGLIGGEELRAGDNVSFKIRESMRDGSRTAFDIALVRWHGQVGSRSRVRAFRNDRDDLRDALAELDADEARNAVKADGPSAADGSVGADGAVEGADGAVEANGEQAASSPPPALHDAVSQKTNEESPSSTTSEDETVGGDKVENGDTTSSKDTATGAIDVDGISQEERLVRFAARGEVGSSIEYKCSKEERLRLHELVNCVNKECKLHMRHRSEGKGTRRVLVVTLESREEDCNVPSLSSLQEVMKRNEPEIPFVPPRPASYCYLFDRTSAANLSERDIVSFTIRFRKGKIFCCNVALVRKAPEVQRTPLKLSLRKSRSEDVEPSIRPERQPFRPDEARAAFQYPRTVKCPLAVARAPEETNGSAEPTADGQPDVDVTGEPQAATAEAKDVSVERVEEEAEKPCMDKQPIGAGESDVAAAASNDSRASEASSE